MQRIAPTIKEAHTLIITLMLRLGYKADIDGVCYGIAAMAANAILAKDLVTFDTRLAHYHIAGKELIDNIMVARKNWADTIKTHRKELQKKRITPKQKSTILNKFIDKTWHELPEEERSYLTAHAFCEGISNYFDPTSIFKSYDKSTPPKRQDFEKTYPLIGNHTLDEQGGVKACESFTGAYTTKELTDYLKTLRKQLEIANVKNPVAIILNNFGHAITLGYDPNYKDWILSIPEELPSQFLSHKKAALAIKKSLSGGAVTCINTSIYTSKFFFDKTNEAVKQWQSKQALADMHAITHTKAHACDADGLTWLELAMHSNQTKLAKKLIANSAEINTQVKSGVAPLHTAVIYNNLELMTLLLKHNANPNIATKSGETPLHIACSMGHTEAATLLLKSGTNPCMRSHAKTKVLIEYAKQHNKLQQLVVLLNERNHSNIPENLTTLTPLHLATLSGSLSCVTAILEAEPRASNMLTGGLSALDLAKIMGHQEIVEVLVKYKSEPVYEPGSSLPTMFNMQDVSTSDDTNYISTEPEGKLSTDRGPTADTSFDDEAEVDSEEEITYNPHKNIK